MSKKRTFTLICLLILGCSLPFVGDKQSKLNSNNGIVKKTELKDNLQDDFEGKAIPKNLDNENNIQIDAEDEAILKNTAIENKTQIDELENKVISKKSDVKFNNQVYLPYLQMNGSHTFSKINFNAAKVDLFLPIWQMPQQLVFADIRAYMPEGRGYEGSLHVGYRQLSEENQTLYGIYTSFDRRKTESGNYFNQITLGVEYWNNGWFIGGNIYRPVGKTTVLNGTSTVVTKDIHKNLWEQSYNKYEIAMTGVDAEVGREFTSRLTGYVGGYYFYAKNVRPICGPKARLSYDLSSSNGGKALGIFDKVSLEAGVQYDKPRGTAVVFGLKLKIGLDSKQQSELSGVARHMIDTVRRDKDVVTNTYSENAGKKAKKKVHGVVLKPLDPEVYKKIDVTDLQSSDADVYKNIESVELQQIDDGANKNVQNIAQQPIGNNVYKKVEDVGLQQIEGGVRKDVQEVKIQATEIAAYKAMNKVEVHPTETGVVKNVQHVALQSFEAEVNKNVTEMALQLNDTDFGKNTKVVVQPSDAGMHKKIVDMKLQPIEGCVRKDVQEVKIESTEVAVYKAMNKVEVYPAETGVVKNIQDVVLQPRGFAVDKKVQGVSLQQAEVGVNKVVGEAQLQSVEIGANKNGTDIALLPTGAYETNKNLQPVVSKSTAIVVYKDVSELDFASIETGANKNVTDMDLQLMDSDVNDNTTAITLQPNNVDDDNNPVEVVNNAAWQNNTSINGFTKCPWCSKDGGMKNITSAKDPEVFPNKGNERLALSKESSVIGRAATLAKNGARRLLESFGKVFNRL